MVCLDTDITVALLKGDEGALSILKELGRERQALKTTAMTTYELMKGAAISSKTNENMRLVKNPLANLTILPFNQMCAEAASELYRALRKSGKMIGLFDILIAATVMTEGDLLVSNDEEFQRVEGLTLQSW